MHGTPTNAALSYGPAAASLLETIREPVQSLAEEFTDCFYSVLTSRSESAVFVTRLGKDELQSLYRRQTEHLILIFSPELTEELHRKHATKAGMVHILVGVDLAWLVQTYNLYLDRIYRLLVQVESQLPVLFQLREIVTARVLADLEYQVSGYSQVETQASSSLLRIDHTVFSVTNLTDMIRGVMADIGSLEGGVSVLFGRPDSAGSFQIEASYGKDAEAYQQGIEGAKYPRVNVQSESPLGQGPGGRAWRTGEIQVCDNWCSDIGSAAWKNVMDEIKLHSVAAIPLLNETGNTTALLCLYSKWTGFFSSPRITTFLAHLQRVLSYGMQRLSHGQVVPVHQQRTYRELLRQKNLEMLYQPIIDLKTGQLRCLEALARLRGPDGKWITPNLFLPAFGEVELIKVFELGLEQIARDAEKFASANVLPDFGINFPASGIADPRYEEVLFSVIDRLNLDPRRLHLELLETDDSGGLAEQGQSFFQRVRERGLHLAQDDLGSGHSSLLRMDQYNFDTVKIDQGLVRSSLNKPHRALEFILYLTRLAHAFNIRVVVEGLENEGMIEAAAILGADHGQGYGICRPMASDRVIPWSQNYNYPIDPMNPRTALGGLAGYLLWDLQQSVVGDTDEPRRLSTELRNTVDSFLSRNEPENNSLVALLRENDPSCIPEVANARVKREQIITCLTKAWLASLAT